MVITYRALTLGELSIGRRKTNYIKSRGFEPWPAN